MSDASAARRPKLKVMTPGIPQGARVRAYLTGACISAALIGIAARAFGFQVEEGDRYRALAARQHELSVAISAPRGDVLDALGRPLAVSADAESIWANPREIRDVTETAAKVARIVGEDAAALEAKLGTARRFVWIDRHVTPEVASAVRAAKLPGIEVAREPRRWYPARSVAGPVIGRADIDGKGLDGIELMFDSRLTGARAEATAVRDARGRRMFADGLAQSEPGESVRLTLDRSIQTIAEDALDQAIAIHRPKNATVVVLDVATSRVLALASYPTYDPNTGVGIAAGARNRPVTDVYEAGSIMKMFSIATALDERVVAYDSWFDLRNGLQISGKQIRDTYHDEALTTAGIFKRSSNIGTVKIAQRLGRDKLYAGLRRFGFGVKTGIELPGEQSGTMRRGEKWRDIELATISYGYGLTVTPLQLAAALAALGNDGVYHAPRILDGAVSPPARVIRSETAKAMRAMMATVFEGGKQHGTGSSIVVPGYLCGGKSGTARKWDSAARQYAMDRHLSTFAGLAPIAAPRLAIAVFVDEPRGGDHYGGKVAGPVFARVASEALRYLGVPGLPLMCDPPPPGPVPKLLVVPPKTCLPPGTSVTAPQVLPDEDSQEP